MSVELRPRVPETFEAAQRLRHELVELFNRAMVESDERQLEWLVAAIRARLDLLPVIRKHFDVEIRRATFHDINQLISSLPVPRPTG